MLNKQPPKPKTCCVCGEDFYGRKDALCCSSRCRKKKQYWKDKDKL